ncbi:MAG: molybdate ABC transporter substrate-binding protein [Verrucomicrobiota bacterium]
MKICQPGNTNILVGVFILPFLLISCVENSHPIHPSDSSAPQKLFLYCAAAMKPAIAKIATQYTEKFDIEINIQYGGSGTLLSNLRVTKIGDLYLAADQSYIEEAAKYELIQDVQALASIRPVIGVREGNPRQIKSLQDLTQETIKIALGNPQTASIGRQSQKLLQEAGLWDALQQNIVVLKPTVNDLANDLKIGAVDAVIIWNAISYQYPEIESITFPESNGYQKKVSLAVLKSTQNSSEAHRFLRYVSTSDEVQAIFLELGYQSVDKSL